MSLIATSDLCNEVLADTKPKAYLVDTHQLEAVARAQDLFDPVLPNTPECQNWCQAEYPLVRGSRPTAEDIESCQNLRAIGKHGVSTDKIDTEACSAREIEVLNTPGVNARAVANWRSASPCPSQDKSDRFHCGKQMAK